jgi:hypothetical protein
MEVDVKNVDAPYSSFHVCLRFRTSFSREVPQQENSFSLREKPSHWIQIPLSDILSKEWEIQQRMEE